jgi:hypothetical protein
MIELGETRRQNSEVGFRIAGVTANASVVPWGRLPMEREHMDWLPVTDSGAKWIGRVEQSAVLVRLVLSVNARTRE